MAEMTKQSGSQDSAAAPTDALSNWSAITSVNIAGRQLLIIAGVAIVVILAIEIAVRALDVPSYVFPTPSAVGVSLVKNAPTLWPHLLVTLQELFLGYIIGATIGILLAALITQRMMVEKIITPYILILVTTPMMALVPLLILKFGFGMTPRIIVIALAVGPMVMINASTGFRRTDKDKLALANSYGASTLQIFTKVRFPLAMPMIIVGLMVGGIFGLLTAVGAEMVGGGMGLGTRLNYYSSLARISSFFAVIVIIAVIGISLYVLFYFVGKKWASWEA